MSLELPFLPHMNSCSLCVLDVLREYTQVRGVMVLKTALAQIYTCTCMDVCPSMCIKMR